MKAKEMIKRYIVFLIGLFICTIGTVLCTKASMGMSPSTCVPYSLALVFTRLSFGVWVIIYCTSLVIIQWIILRKRADKIELILQIIMAATFGGFVDMLTALMGWINPVGYIAELCCMLGGCLVIAIGTFIQLKADVVMLSCDALARAVALVSRKEFGKVKVGLDLLWAATSAAITLIVAGQLSGVREGTVIAAIVTGNIIRFLGRKVHIFDKMLPPRERSRA